MRSGEQPAFKLFVPFLGDMRERASIKKLHENGPQALTLQEKVLVKVYLLEMGTLASVVAPFGGFFAAFFVLVVYLIGLFRGSFKVRQILQDNFCSGGGQTIPISRDGVFWLHVIYLQHVISRIKSAHT